MDSTSCLDITITFDFLVYFVSVLQLVSESENSQKMNVYLLETGLYILIEHNKYLQP